jgi:hypothetical protein
MKRCMLFELKSKISIRGSSNVKIGNVAYSIKYAIEVFIFTCLE